MAFHRTDMESFLRKRFRRVISHSELIIIYNFSMHQSNNKAQFFISCNHLVCSVPQWGGFFRAENRERWKRHGGTNPLIHQFPDQTQHGSTAILYAHPILHFNNKVKQLTISCLVLRQRNKQLHLNGPITVKSFHFHAIFFR